MQRLVEGIHRFRQDRFTNEQSFFEKLVEGQHPIALFITCSDSRIDPNLITQTGPGELFILRTAGNIVPPHGSGYGGEAATIEYAVAALGIKDVIVCGHSHCGAMGGLMKLEALSSMPAVAGYLQHAAATRRIIQENYKDVSDEAEQVNLAVNENVLVQLENLRTHPSVAAALSRGDLKLHGWVYKFETGEIFAYSPKTNSFEVIESDIDAAIEQPRSVAVL